MAHFKELKENLHPRNRHREGYNFPFLAEHCPELKNYMGKNKYGVPSLDFSQPRAVHLLNKTLLMTGYDLDYWEIPEGYLCPSIPSRAEMIHRLADLLGEEQRGKAPRGPGIRVLDIGTGANLVYPIIGHREYGWSFVGAETNTDSLESAGLIIQRNPGLQEAISLRPQRLNVRIFKGILHAEDYFDLSLCNPPFFASPEEAAAGTRRKWKNLKKNADQPTQRTFGGRSNELWYPGGERAFLEKMVEESAAFPKNCYWYSALVSKKSNVEVVESAMRRAGAQDGRIIEMAYGNKRSRVAAWTFLEEKQRKAWRKGRW